MASYLQSKQAAEYLRIGTSTLSKLRSSGDGPRFLKFGRSVRYRIEDLDAWAEARVDDAEPKNDAHR